MKAKQIAGFTLVELIVVIVLLGVLAAVAIPRYANNTQQARGAVLNGIAGSIRSSAAEVQGLYQIAYANSTSGAPTTVTMRDGTVVAVSVGTGAGANGGLPSPVAGGIDHAITLPAEISYDPTSQHFYYTAIGNIATCNVYYNTPAASGANPITITAVTVTSTGC